MPVFEVHRGSAIAKRKSTPSAAHSTPAISTLLRMTLAQAIATVSDFWDSYEFASHTRSAQKTQSRFGTIPGHPPLAKNSIEERGHCFERIYREAVFAGRLMNPQRVSRPRSAVGRFYPLAEAVCPLAWHADIRGRCPQHQRSRSFNRTCSITVG